ncbi:MAG: threonine ammonia-lyase [Sporichthyaceae bacterium]
MPSDLPVTRADVLAAREVLEAVARITPVVGSRVLTARCGGEVRFKCENLQRSGSFKIRGAYVRLSRLSEAERAAGVIAASAGNHGQGVALAASLLGITATVLMPNGAPLPKIAATEGYGATVRLVGHSVADALLAAAETAEQTGATFIHPFDHADIVAGQGSVGLEILEQVPDVRTVVVPTGGGGLLAGVAAALSHRPDVRIVGVQAASAAAWPGSLAAGHPVALDHTATMADGIAVAKPGDVPFAVVADLVSDVRTVSEEYLSQALLLCLERAKLVVEPAGAAAVAALLDDPQAFEPPIVAVLSGGNVDPLLMLRLLRHGLAAAGRYVAFRLRLPDRPGALAALLRELAEADANVLEVEHLRTNPRLHVEEVEVYVQLETRGGKHTDVVLARLRAAGYSLAFG